MKVLNKTDKELKIRVTDRYGHMYSIYLPGGRSTDLAPNQISRDILDFIKLGYLKDISRESKRSDPISVNIIENPVTIECACALNHSEDPIHNEGLSSSDTSDDSNEDDTLVDEDSAADNHEDNLEQSTSVYKCDICGSEFASPRGLSMHKNRSHPNDLNKEE